jgi:hypothetical protein
MDIGNAADPAAAKSEQGNVEGGWHVHPSGESLTPNGTMGFNQNPSACSGCDVDNALSGTNIVVGARSQEVTFYTGSSSNVGQMSLGDFMSLPQ